MRTWGLLALAVLSAQAPDGAMRPTSSGSSDPASYIEALASVERALERQDSALALRLVDEALQAYPDQPRLVYARASAHALTGHLKAARDALERAVELGFDDAALADWDPRLAAVREARPLDDLVPRPSDAPPEELPFVSRWGTERPRLDAELGLLEVGPWTQRCLLDWATGALIGVRADRDATYGEHEDATPDGRWSVAHDRDRVTLRERETDAIRWEVASPRRNVLGAGYIDEQTVAVSLRDGCIELRDGFDGDLLRTIRGLGLQVQAVHPLGGQVVFLTGEGTL